MVVHCGGDAGHVAADQAGRRHGGPVKRHHPDGLPYPDISTGHIKRHTGEYVWEVPGA